MNNSKILLDDKKVSEYDVKPYDQIILNPGKELTYDENDGSISQMRKLGFSKEEILAALANAENDVKLAFNILYEQFEMQ